MRFVKLDTKLLTSSLWVDREGREVFITALLMANPCELHAPEPQLAVRELTETGFIISPGRYGFIAAAGSGIVRQAGVSLKKGLDALERLGSADLDSRSKDYEGRRLVRIDGGYIVLNYMKYFDFDHTSADRSRRYRANKKASRVTGVTQRVTGVTPHRNVTELDVRSNTKTNTARARVPFEPGIYTGPVVEIPAEEEEAIRLRLKAHEGSH